MHRASRIKTETPAITGRAEPGRDIFAGEPIKEIKKISKNPEKADLRGRAPKKTSAVVTSSTESVKAESTESSNVETPDTASATSQKEEPEPLVDGPEGAAAMKTTECLLTGQMLKLKSCTRVISGSCLVGHF